MESLREIEAKAIQQAINDFHWYMNEGMSYEKAKEIILKSSIYSAVHEYVKNYQGGQK